MARLSNKIFSVVSQDGGGSVMASLTNKFNKKVAGYDKEMERRIRAATNLVWRTAHQKRPMMTAAQARAHGSRVSLPDTIYTSRGYAAGKNIALEAQNFGIPGVPVAAKNGGRLQISVLQKVTRLFGLMSFEGQIQAGAGVPYASYIEYGTTRMAARPFMRPAIALNKEAIKRGYGVTFSSNL